MTSLERTIVVNRYLVVISAFAGLILLSSYVNEYLFSSIPCRMCKLQRLPYFVIFISAIFGVISNKKHFFNLILKIGFAVSFGFALYHLLIQYGLIADSCAMTTTITDLNSFKAMLQSHIPCSKISWSLFGLPIPFYNAMGSFVLFLYTYKIDKT
jgi:disulfide bond formation protein DsbB